MKQAKLLREILASIKKNELDDEQTLKVLSSVMLDICENRQQNFTATVGRYKVEVSLRNDNQIL